MKIHRSLSAILDVILSSSSTSQTSLVTTKESLPHHRTRDLSSYTTTSSSPISTSSLDINRPAVKLDVDSVKPAGTYVDVLDYHVEVDMMIAGKEMQTFTDMHLDMESIVTDLIDGTHSIDVKFVDATYHFETDMQQTLHCDSTNPQSNTNQDFCQTVVGGVTDGASVHLVVDDQGQVVPDTTSSTTSTTTTTSSTSAGDSTNSQLSSSTDQFMAANRLLTLLPKHPVAPGDSWDTNDESFAGTATLLGYQLYDGHDVAVIGIVGVEQMDWDKVKGSLGMGNNVDFTTSEIDVTATLYYDPQTKFARFVSMDMNFEMHIKNPLDGSDTTMPIQSTLSATAQLKDE